MILHAKPRASWLLAVYLVVLHDLCDSTDNLTTVSCLRASHLDDLVFTEYLLFESGHMTLLQCAASCANDDRCVAFTFSRLKSQTWLPCRGNSRVEVSNGLTAIGFKSYILSSRLGLTGTTLDPVTENEEQTSSSHTIDSGLITTNYGQTTPGNEKERSPVTQNNDQTSHANMKEIPATVASTVPTFETNRDVNTVVNVVTKKLTSSTESTQSKDMHAATTSVSAGSTDNSASGTTDIISDNTKGNNGLALGKLKQQNA